MLQDVFIVGERVFLTDSKQFGTVLKVTVHKNPYALESDGVRVYDIKLEGTGEIRYGATHGIERAPTPPAVNDS